MAQMDKVFMAGAALDGAAMDGAARDRATKSTADTRLGLPGKQISFIYACVATLPVVLVFS